MPIPVREVVCASEESATITLPDPARAVVHDNTVLSFSFEKELLPPREAALRKVGYNVFSTTSEACVRFEIQMGQCGVLLMCYTIPEPIACDLAALFDRHCHSGVIAFVTDPLNREVSRAGQVSFLDSELSQKLHLIEDFRAGHRPGVLGPGILPA